MCIADLAAGRRTLLKTQQQTVTLAAGYMLPADPRRIRLLVTAPNNQGWLQLSATAAVAGTFAAFMLNNNYQPRPLLIEEYGAFLLGDIYFISLLGDSNVVYIAEVLADHTLDTVIQREVR